MKHILPTLIFALCTALCGHARDAKAFFADEGASAAFSEIGATERLDMLDYFAAGQEHPVANIYSGRSRLLRADSAAVSVEVAHGVVVDMYVLPAGRDTVLMVVETVELPQKDSNIAFYGADWRPLKKSPLPKYVLSDWLSLAGSKERDEVERRLPFILAQAVYNPDTQVLRLSNTMDEYFVDDEDKAFVAQNLRKSLAYTWKNGKFVLEK